MTQASARAAGQPEKPALHAAASEQPRLPQEPRTAPPLETRAGAVVPPTHHRLMLPEGGTPIPLPGWVPALPASCPPQPPQHHDGAAQTRSAGRLAVGCSAGEASQARHGPENWGRSASPPVFLPAVGHAHPRCLARIVPRCRRWDGRRGARRQV